MAGLGGLFVCSFGDWLIPILIASHRANNLDRGDEAEDEGYESKEPREITSLRSKSIK